MKRILFLLLFSVSHSIAAVFTPEEQHQLKQNFFDNFLANGAIVASPSTHDPNYYYDWVRDSAISMMLIESWYDNSKSHKLKHRLLQYITWTEKIQHEYDPNPYQDILGEPKFYVDGAPFVGPWGRPQNDGPALRAIVLTRFATQLLNDNEGGYVSAHLYNNTLDPNSMGSIKLDLEYVAHHWQDANFDLWEEVYGQHFFTAMVQQRALDEGAVLARRLDDVQAARYYETQAHQIEIFLKKHLDHTNNLIQATLPPHPGPQKTLELDTAIVLGVLLNPHDKGAFSPEHYFVKNTVKALHEQFNLLYPINNNGKGAILFGRYPGDTYDGHSNQSLGNPWFIMTATMAEYYFTLAKRLPEDEANKSTFFKYRNLGDNYLMLIKKYAKKLRISEQINLKTGNMQGADSLTWSYSSLLRAIDLRAELEDRYSK